MIKFTRRQKARQDKELRNWFETYNDRFYNGEISLATQVMFEDGVYDHKDKDAADAYYLANELKIKIDSHLRGRGRQWRIVLLHEMGHAWLYQAKGYVGMPGDGGHGTTFQGVLCGLIQKGAYDGLL